jgi:hypothetical protein
MPAPTNPLADQPRRQVQTRDLHQQEAKGNQQQGTTDNRQHVASGSRQQATFCDGAHAESPEVSLEFSFVILSAIRDSMEKPFHRLRGTTKLLTTEELVAWVRDRSRSSGPVNDPHIQMFIKTYHVHKQRYNPATCNFYTLLRDVFEPFDTIFFLDLLGAKPTDHGLCYQLTGQHAAPKPFVALSVNNFRHPSILGMYNSWTGTVNVWTKQRSHADLNLLFETLLHEMGHAFTMNFANCSNGDGRALVFFNPCQLMTSRIMKWIPAFRAGCVHRSRNYSFKLLSRIPGDPDAPGSTTSGSRHRQIEEFMEMHIL